MSLCYFSPVSHYTHNAVFKDARKIDRNVSEMQEIKGVTVFVSEIKRVEKYPDFEKFSHFCLCVHCIGV